MVNIQWKYVSPLKEGTEVECLEIKYHYPLPEDLKKCIEKYNGGIPTPEVLDFSENKNKVFGGLLSFNEGEDDNIYDFVELFENKEKTGLTMFPFGIDPAGNFYCVKDKKIVFYNHETNQTVPICDTFTQFIKMLHEKN